MIHTYQNSLAVRFHRYAQMLAASRQFQWPPLLSAGQDSSQPLVSYLTLFEETVAGWTLQPNGLSVYHRAYKLRTKLGIN